MDIMKSDVPCTILRPGSFRDDYEFKHLKKAVVTDEEGKLSPSFRVSKPAIGLDDLAEICIECLDSNASIDGKVLYPRWEATDFKNTGTLH